MDFCDALIEWQQECGGLGTDTMERCVELYSCRMGVYRDDVVRARANCIRARTAARCDIPLTDGICDGPDALAVPPTPESAEYSVACEVTRWSSVTLWSAVLGRCVEGPGVAARIKHGSVRV